MTRPPPGAPRARHRERLRAAARPRRHRVAGGPARRGAGAAAVRPAGRARRRRRPAGGAQRARARAPAVRGRTATARVVHGLPQRRRLARRDVRQRHPGVRTSWSARGCSTGPPASPASWWPPAAGRAAWAPPPDGDYWVDMGPARPFGAGDGDRVRAGRSPALAVSMGNPHLVCLTDVRVEALDLTGAPSFDAGAVPGGRQRRVRQRAAARAGTSGCGCTSAAWGRPAPAAPARAPPPTRPCAARGRRPRAPCVVDVPGRPAVGADQPDGRRC